MPPVAEKDILCPNGLREQETGKQGVEILHNINQQSQFSVWHVQVPVWEREEHLLNKLPEDNRKIMATNQDDASIIVTQHWVGETVN